MGKKFRPISYNVSDIRSFKFKGASDVPEGYICAIATGGDSTYNWVDAAGGKVLKVTGTTTLLTAATNHTLAFPIYRMEMDLETVGGTISKNDYVLGIHGKGVEYEVHKDVSQCALGSYTVGGLVCVASTSKFVAKGKTTARHHFIGVCLGTFGGDWLRIKTL